MRDCSGNPFVFFLKKTKDCSGKPDPQGHALLNVVVILYVNNYEFIILNYCRGGASSYCCGYFVDCILYTVYCRDG